MALILRITSQQCQALGAAGIREFTAAGGTIGRAPDNTLVLPDPERFVSGQHAAIEVEGDRYFLVDTSTNGTYVNNGDQPVGHGRRVELNSGDRIQIGDFELAVSIEPVPSVAGHGAFATPGNGYDSNPFGVSGSVPAPTDPLDGLGSADFLATSPTQPPPQLDPLAGGPGTLDPLQASGLPGPADEPYDLLQDRTPFGPPAGTFGDAVQGLGDHFQAPGIRPDDAPGSGGLAPDAGFDIGDDWDKTSYGQTSSPPPPPQRTGPNPNARPQQPAPTGLQQTAQPRGPVQPAPRGPTPESLSGTYQMPTGPMRTGGAGDLRGLRKLLETAGLDAQSAQEVATEDLAETFGQILQVFVHGMMDVLKARAQVKSEFRVPVTQIRPVENNPLKFCVDVRDALYSLFVKRGGGFLPPVEAFDEGFEDIRAHQLAMMAGMRAAFDGLMNRLDPAHLEEEFDQGLRRSAMFKSFNKMQYWEMYRDMYAEITSDADENFQRQFGDAFAKAYEEQMYRLTGMRRR